MHCNTLRAFRHGFYGCLQRAAAALFQAAAALLTQPSATSVAELSLAPCFQRRWPSVYAAFADGQIDRSALRALFAHYAPAPPPGQRLLLGLDASNIPRPESPTAADRTALFVHNLPQCAHPVTVGWQFSTLVVLPPTPSSWSYTLDNERIPSTQTAAEIGAAQLRALVPQLPQRPLLTADRHYGSAAFVAATADVPCDKLLWLCRNRVFYRPAPPRTGKRGQPRKDGAVFKCHDPATHGAVTQAWAGVDDTGQRVEVAAWADLHYRQARAVAVTVVRLTRHGASAKPRDPRVSWFLWVGAEPVPLADVGPSYRLRFSMEHGYRFSKQDLLWERAHLRTPAQFQRWTDVVEAVRNQIVLSRELDGVVRRPWERGARAATPAQVRRGLGAILGELGSPAPGPQVRGKSAPGRTRGQAVPAATRYRVVYKGAAPGEAGARRRKQRAPGTGAGAPGPPGAATAA